MQIEQVTSTTTFFKTLAFIDLETTGFRGYEFNIPKITQLSIIACSVEHILELKNETDVPRVQQKLSLSFNPYKLIKHDCTDATKLTNELLEKEKKFDEKTVEMIEIFLEHLQQPVCFLAHNGHNFDYPILKRQCKLVNKSLPKSLLCCDSFEIFKRIDDTYDEFRTYFKLTEIYKRFFGKYPENHHDAESDAYALLQCVCACKKEFLNAAMRTTYYFCDVKEF